MRRPLPSLLQVSRLAIAQSLEWIFGHLPHDTAFTLIDGTCGNGHDTLFLAQTASAHLMKHPQAKGHLLAFDIQTAAIQNTRQRLASHCSPPNLHLAVIQAGHESAACQCPAGAPPMLAVYNLGFLPGSDKSIITSEKNSLASFEGLAPLMGKNGVFVIHAYGGHQGGLDELKAVRQWAASLPPEKWTSRCYETLTHVKNPESLFLIEKKD